MKVVILAGGFGTRLSEETDVKPKPMIEIGGRPILWHIMKIYASFGFKEFIVALGYKGEVIKDYFYKYFYLQNSFSINLKSGQVKIYNGAEEDWTIHLIDTGADTLTGGRIKRLAPWIGDETFMMTYGDGVARVDIKSLVDFHKKQGKLATLTAVRAPAHFGSLAFDDDTVKKFAEKPHEGREWISGGFFVLEPGVMDYIPDDRVFFEREPLEKLTRDRQLAAYRHEGFWQCMDTLRDVRLLNDLWDKGDAPWKVW